MLYFTKYAEKKFDLLNNHKVFITKEQVESAANQPTKLENKKKFYIAELEGVAVVYEKQKSVKRILTFYPIK